MSAIQVIVSAIITSLILFQAVQIGDAQCDVQKYFGSWHTISVSLHYPDVISCELTKVTERKNDGEWIFNYVSSAIIDGRLREAAGHGRVHDSTIYLKYPSTDFQDIFTVSIYSNGNELILHERGDRNYHALLSRNNTGSPEAKAALARYAASGNCLVVEVSHEGCTYDYDR